MTPRRLTTFWKVRSVLALFIQMGCELRTVEEDAAAMEGDVRNVRYLLNPENGQFVAIVDLGDDEFVSAGEAAYWERRPGVEITKPPPAET